MTRLLYFIAENSNIEKRPLEVQTAFRRLVILPLILT